MTHKKSTFKALYILTAIGAAAAIFCAYGLIQELYTQGQGRDFYAALTAVAEDSSGKTAPTVASSETGSAEQNIAFNFDFLALRENLRALRETYPDLIAWIRCEDTVINYPVMQGGDNDYYLNHLPDGTANKMGSIFLDYRNSPDFSDKNLLIYGHHMDSGDMFSALEKYKTQQFFDEHPEIILYTPDGIYAIKIFAGYVVNAVTEIPSRDFRSDKEFLDYVKKLRSRSLFTSSVEVSPDDRIISLCTCTYDFANARFIVAGKLELIPE